MRQIRLTPEPGLSPTKVKAFFDWLTSKRAKNELPFSVVMIDTAASEQYGVLIHCDTLHDRDAVLEALRELESGSYPADRLMQNQWVEVEPGKRLPRTVGLRELRGQPIGRVFE
jgi:hypothetical protein